MAIPSKEQVISTIEKPFGIRLYQLPNKRIFYQGDDMLVCTPGSKIYPNGNGWIDLTAIQVELMATAKTTILAVRLENGKTMYVRLGLLKPFLTPSAMRCNKREGDHWKIHIYDDRVKVIGNGIILPLSATNFNENSLPLLL